MKKRTFTPKPERRVENLKCELRIEDHTPGETCDIYRMYYNVEGGRYTEARRVLVAQDIANGRTAGVIAQIRNEGR